MKWLLIVIWFADHHILPLERFDTIEQCGARAVAMLPVYRGKANLACNLDPGPGK